MFSGKGVNFSILEKIYEPNRKKMKNIYLFVLLFAFGSTAFAQSFTVSPDTIQYMTIAQGASDEATIRFTNSGNGDIVLVWELSGNTLHPDWSVSICDNNLCYFNVHPGDTMAPVASAAFGFLKFTCAVDTGDSGSGQLKYNVHIAGSPETMVEVTFDVNSAATSVSVSSLANQVSISPNPTSSTLTMRATSGKLAKGDAQIYDLSGRLLRKVPVKGLDALDINVEDLPQGTYLLRYLSNEDVVTRRFVKTN